MHAAAIIRRSVLTPSCSDKQAHGPIIPPSGSYFTSINVGNGGEQIAAYWTQNPQNSTARQAFIMIHGRERDGDAVSVREVSFM